MGYFNAKPPAQDSLLGEDTRWRQRSQQTRTVTPMQKVGTVAAKVKRSLDDHMAKQRKFTERHRAAVAAGEEPKAAQKRLAREMWPEWYASEQEP